MSKVRKLLKRAVLNLTRRGLRVLGATEAESVRIADRIWRRS